MREGGETAPELAVVAATILSRPGHFAARPGHFTVLPNNGLKLSKNENEIAENSAFWGLEVPMSDKFFFMVFNKNN